MDFDHFARSHTQPTRALIYFSKMVNWCERCWGNTEMLIPQICIQLQAGQHPTRYENFPGAFNACAAMRSV